jgi:hypothetical protein
MRGARWRECAGGIILLLLTGCAGQQIAGFGLFQGGNGSEYMVSGSTQEVALTLQASLRRLGLSAEMTQQGEDIRIASKTRNGDKFALVLKRVTGQPGETSRTRVRIEWESGPDEQTRTHVLASLNVQSPTSPSK